MASMVSYHALDNLLESNGIKAVHVAKICGVSEDTLSRARNGKQVSYGTASRIASALGVEVEVLFERYIPYDTR